MAIVANIILEQHRTATEANHAQQLESVLGLLPRLSRGLDLNIFFGSISKFEFTEEISVFDSLGIPLLHGWIADRDSSTSSSLLSGLSYNHLVFKIVEFKSLCEDQDSKKQYSETEQELLRSGHVLEQFLHSTASQLTHQGISDLYECVKDRQLAVFFRNNHFSTIFSYGGMLFSLVTDHGYIDEPFVVWESLNEITG